ncbi:hypothetical protein HYW19_01100 [Candidatus Woesearchaeota archaeon]|nr:hypothetical protein [Candidatus Woesearchaeota archaeon]
MHKTQRNQKFLVSRKFYGFSRKSQAALEFLTTYAWAFLVIIIMVGALAYFGVLSPSKLLPDRCNFGPEIGCDKNTMVVNNLITPANALTMRLNNNVGAPITVTQATTTTDVTAAGACTAKMQKDGGSEVDPEPGATPVTLAWDSDETITFIAECSAGDKLVEKEKIKFNIEINYYPTASGSTYVKTAFGEVFTTIQ